MGIDTVFVNHTKRQYYTGSNRLRTFPDGGGGQDAWALAWLMNNDWRGDHVVIDGDINLCNLTGNLDPKRDYQKYEGVVPGMAWAAVYDDGSFHGPEAVLEWLKRQEEDA